MMIHRCAPRRKLPWYLRTGARHEYSQHESATLLEGRGVGHALGDPRAVELRQDLDLLLDVVDLVLGVLEVNDLDGDEVARALLDAAADGGKPVRSSADNEGPREDERAPLVDLAERALACARTRRTSIRSRPTTSACGVRARTQGKKGRTDDVLPHVEVLRVLRGLLVLPDAKGRALGVSPASARERSEHGRSGEPLV